MRYAFTLSHSVYCFFFQAEDGIRDLVRSRGLGDVYKRQDRQRRLARDDDEWPPFLQHHVGGALDEVVGEAMRCLLYTSDAADERSSVDLGGRRIIKKKKQSIAQDREHD